ncbi:MAG: phage tail tape measure protein [Oscillospiraceae bacterium]|nr:phage tail tape measure protein [Oscillospiraceae bacterium]
MANRIKGLVVTIDGETTGLDKALKSVNTTIKDTQSKLKDVEKLLKLDPSNTELLSQKQQTLKEKISATKEKLDALKTAQEQAKQQLENGDLGKDKYDALQREIIATEEELKNLAREAAEANETLNKIDSVGKTFENIGSKMSKVGGTLTKTVTAPIVGIGAAAVKTTADFDEQMSKVGAISGATGKDFDDLRAKAREMGAKTKFSATEAGQGFEYMAMAGWKTGDMLDGIEGIMNLAAASGEDLGTTSDIVTDALTAFGLSAKDSGHFADVLASASSNANTNVSMLGESFKYAAPVAGALGINAEDTSIALGLMANAGIKASQAGTSLRTGLTNMAKPTKQMQTYMDRYNIALVQNKDGSINLRETMISLREKMGGLTESEQAAAASAIFGKNSMAGWLAIINASDQDFDKLTSAIDNCDGSAEQMALTMQDNLSGQITILKSALQELMIQIGDALMPTIRNIVSHIQTFIEKLQGMDEGTRNTILRVAAFAAAIGPVLLVVGKLTTGVGKAMQAISSMGKGILTFVNQAKLGVGAGGQFASAIAAIGPVGWIIIAVVAALTAAFVHLWNTSDEFKEKITAHWEKLREKFQAVGEKITEAINSLGFSFEDLGAVFDWLCNEVFAPLLDTLLGSVMDTFGDIIEVFGGVVEVIIGIIKGFKDGDWSLVWQGISDIATGIINLLFEPIQWLFHLFGVELDDFDGDWSKVWTGIKDFFTTIWNSIREFFSGIWESIKSVVTGALSAVSTGIQNAWNAVSSFFTTIWNGIKEFFSGIWEGMKTAATTTATAISSGVQNAWNAVFGFFTTIWNGISGFFSGVWSGMKTAASTAWEGIKTGVTTAWNAVRDTTSTAWGNVKTFFGNTWSSLKETATTAWTNIKSGVSTTWNAIKDTTSSVWSGIKTFFSTTWEGMKTAATTAWTNIKSGLSTAWESVKSTTSTVWGNIKTSLGTTWDGIKSSVSTAYEAVKAGISTAWENVKTKTSTIWESVKGNTSTAWESIKSKATTVAESVKTSVGTAWDNLKTKLSTVMENMKSSASTGWTNMKSSITTAAENIKNSVSTAFSNLKNTASTTWNNIKTAMTGPIDTAKSYISGAISNIKGLFNFSWSFPSIKMPHFSWYWQDIGGLVSIPMFSVSWYKKAMDNPLLLNGATIFGAMNGQFLGGGEAGSEMVIGTKTLMNTIRQAVAGLVSGEMNVNYGGVTVNVYSQPGQDISSLADEIEERINMNVARRAAAFS